MRIRGGTARDFAKVKELFEQDGFHLDVSHLELLIIVEDESNGEIIAAASLVTLLEASFVVNKSYSSSTRALALKDVIALGEKTVKNLNYEYYHSFASNDAIEKITKRKFGYEDAMGKNLIKWIS